jgi:Domain of unknown function (DUF4276)
MVKEIRIYVEGGGDKKDTKARIREGFSGFLKDVVQIACSKRIKWQIIICGSRNSAFSDFQNALEDHGDAFNVLLVDSESPVKTTPWKHLKSRDNWNSPGVDDTHCHLMVQTMEAWFIADVDTLKKFYGQKFKENVLPKNPKVEEIEKDSLEASLKAATRDTSKGEYQKIQHASQLLKLLDVAKVRKASPYCDRFFTTLTQMMEPPSDNTDAE